MNEQKDFDEYSNYDDRQLHNSKAAPKMGHSTKEEFGREHITNETLAKKKHTENRNRRL
ncbi:hypothetical protein SAMN05880501_104151 [Ureibacillus xyleni]|uniref:Uncharacterized protein n=1 Tax=Ureibacillus xyleni TaxID=614648 RepID=A0A285SEA3_9BACL|nr:hypothetical protein [Ureibacillus xyleni]SOC05983.1 hypothetical protein SAMN05880501_104151 [Ureibacillus xyleni]